MEFREDRHTEKPTPGEVAIMSFRSTCFSKCIAQSLLIMSAPLVAMASQAKSTPLYQRTDRSELRWTEGVKYPEADELGREPVFNFSLSAPLNALGGFNELLPYLLRSPDQQDAGSCLYMANTGVAEWWLARLSPEKSRDPNGPLDLSERYLMNVAGIEEAENGVQNWRTDTIYLFNSFGNRGILNSTYPFAMGWYKEDSEGQLVQSHQLEQGAQYGATYSWINELSTIQGGEVSLPSFQRDVLFKDPESNQWNVGIVSNDLVSEVKRLLNERKAPIQVIYNHFGYWHANLILGYDDGTKLEDCPMVQRSRRYFPSEIERLRRLLARTDDPQKQETLRKRIEKFSKTVRDLEGAYESQGGCRNEGVFYVRDSIYADKDGPIYDYDRSSEQENSPYAKRVVLLEYDWLVYLANHVTQIYDDHSTNFK